MCIRDSSVAERNGRIAADLMNQNSKVLGIYEAAKTVAQSATGSNLPNSRVDVDFKTFIDSFKASGSTKALVADVVLRTQLSKIRAKAKIHEFEQAQRFYFTLDNAPDDLRM